MLRYVEILFIYMGVNLLEVEEFICDEDSFDFEFIVYDFWKIIGRIVENIFNKIYIFYFLLGLIYGECFVLKLWVDCLRKVFVI